MTKLPVGKAICEMKGHLSDIGYDAERHNARIDALRHFTDITKIIEAVVEIYQDCYNQTPYEINCGNCEEFASDVVDILKNGSCAVWHDNMTDCTELESFWWSHKFIIHGERFYDSECSEGVDAWRELPVFTRNPVVD